MCTCDGQSRLTDIIAPCHCKHLGVGKHGCSMHVKHRWCTNMAMDMLHCILLHCAAAPRPRSPCPPAPFMHYPHCSAAASVMQGHGLEVAPVHQRDGSPVHRHTTALVHRWRSEGEGAAVAALGILVPPSCCLCATCSVTGETLAYQGCCAATLVNQTCAAALALLPGPSFRLGAPNQAPQQKWGRETVAVPQPTI